MATALAPAQQRQLVELQTQVKDLKADKRTLQERATEIANEYSAKVRKWATTDGPTMALYAGGGALGGALFGYWLFDQAVAYFGADSKVGVLATAAVGATLLWATPKLVKVSAKKLDSTLPLASALYGASCGVLGVGLYRAWQNWPQSA